MAMFTVYGDASGSDPALPILALGGFISTVQQWEEFCKRWPKVLASGSVSAYHAADLESRKGEFARWGEKKKLRFQILACQTLARYVAAGVASVIKERTLKHTKFIGIKFPKESPQTTTSFVSMISLKT